ncbi:MAG: C4-type zinc ribbon domain-containing protein [Clostridiales bacterium]|jgi:predicted  nucleic acid-binding Zn-ribbon protein|nr:C4-type zinc ribbon domain-containing protein [Clostridiales bacterium]
MSKFEGILSYQRLDARLRELEKEIEKSEDYKRATAAKEAYSDAKKRAEISEQRAGDVVAHFDKLGNIYADTLKRLEELELNVLPNGLTEENAEKYKTQINKLNERLSAIEKELNAIGQRNDEIARINEDARKSGTRSRGVFNESKEKFEAFKKEREPTMDELRAQLDKMSKGIDKKLFDAYQALRKDRVLPAFVTLERPNSCSGCRMEISMQSVSKLKADGTVECENCRRIIYSSDG